MKTNSLRMQSRWKWVILLLAVVYVGLFGLAGWWRFHDRSRSQALRLFELLTPGINEGDALRLMYSQKNVRVTRIDGAISTRLGGWRCTVDDRFTLGFCFRPDKTLWTKYVNELDPAPSELPDWLGKQLDKIGFCTQPIYRHWP